LLLILSLLTHKVFVAGRIEAIRERILEQQRFKAMIVWLIANGKAETALERLAEHYRVGVPRLKVGLPKGRRKKTLGCYTPKNQTISVSNSDTLKEPFVILHEFYHHTRIGLDMKHKGTERYADGFAKDFIQAYNAMARASGK
jgi:hypothetical protein